MPINPDFKKYIRRNTVTRDLNLAKDGANLMSYGVFFRIAPTEDRPTCTFFRQLWSCDRCPGRDMSQQRAWVTEQKHVSGAPTYDSRKYIIAKATQLVLVHQYASMCDGEACIRTDAEHTLECMTSEGSNKYRVRRLAHGFVTRSHTLHHSHISTK